MRVIGKNFFLPDLHFGKRCIFLNKLDTKVKLTLLTPAFKHVINSGDEVSGLQVPASEAKASGVKVRNLIGT